MTNAVNEPLLVEEMQLQTRDGHVVKQSAPHPSSVLISVADSQKPNTAKSIPTLLTWKNLSYTVPSPDTKSTKKLLDRITGYAKSGEMLAVMGPSGAGKSTFLDLISGRKTLKESHDSEDGQLPASLLLNGKSDFDLRLISSYVEQDDALFGSLTVAETLYYSARLSLPPSLSRSDISQRVDRVLTQLGLSQVSTNLIGTPIQRGVSGGQKRRVTIGNALITNPLILFLDEPTSERGKTSTKDKTAQNKNNIIPSHPPTHTVKHISQTRNVLIICTIHQPNYDTFSLFDNLLLLASGKTMYFGPVADLPPYCTEIGHPIPPFRNPADHILSFVNPDFAGSREDAEGHVEGLAEKWAVRQRGVEQFVVGEERRAAAAGGVGGVEGLRSEFGGASVGLYKTWVLMERAVLNYRRNLLAYGVRAGMYVGMGLLLAIVWVKLGTKQEKLQDRISVHFFSVAFLGFMSVAGIPAFLEDRAVYLREYHNGLYGPAAYTLANSLVSIPFLFVCVLIFTLICYWAIGLKAGAGHFFQFLVYLFLAIYAAESQSILIAALIPIFIAALAIAAFANGMKPPVFVCL
ncbi:hypothetical protein HDV00_011245 [Rhizophlyctis rosea]|nr:hypothetical protein HDV00_011245 [Rhizophlyctis rosea]